MLQIAEWFARILVPFLLGGAALLGTLFLYLLLQRAFATLSAARTRTIENRYEKALAGFLTPEGGRDALLVLRAAPKRHRRLLGRLLLAPLRVARGEIVTSIREATAAAGLQEIWLADLGSRRWWVRADAARALGLVAAPDGLAPITRLLDDDHHEVRAAAVEALGLFADPRSARALLDALSDASRFQRARVVDALAHLGPDAVPVIAAHGRTHPEDVEIVAEVLGLIGGSSAVEDLLRWSAASDPAIRAAALRALGTIGLDDRTYYYALRALSDSDPQVRGLAARALGRAGRGEASAYIAPLLDDEWIAAAHGATALKRLGAAGEGALKARADDPGLAGDLARQMLWERASPGGAA